MRKSIILLALALLVMTGCKKEKVTDPQPPTDGKNLAVYGKIYTAEGDANSTAEAFVVKDGRFVYVGTKDGAEDYIDDNTTIINHTEGMVIPGCYEGHAHYLMQNGLNLMNGPAININTSVSEFFEEVKNTYQRAKAEGKSSIYGFGWLYQSFEYDGMPTRRQSVIVGL